MQARIALLTEIISPYRIPVFNEINQSLTGQFLVLFLGKTEKRRQWKIYREKIDFRYRVLPSILFQNGSSGAPYFLNPTIFYELMRYSPEIIITGGYQHPSYLLAILYARIFKKRIILWCESNKYDLRLCRPWNEFYKRMFVRSCDGYIAPGKASSEYLISLGASAKKIWMAPNAVDNAYFIQSCDRYRQNKDSFKQSKGYPEKLILYVGRLSDQKGIFDLLEAFRIIFAKDPDAGLLLVGSGEQEKQYKDFCLINNLKNVFFEGFIHQEKLPFYYAIADVFVLPTHSDPWGLVLNEAMACGLAVVSSDAAGAAPDLIIQGENGYVFKKGDIRQIVFCLENILGDEQKRTEMGKMSLEIIKNYSPFKCAQGFIRAIREV